MHVQLEEVTRLKRITEKSLEEALESLQIEREQRHNLKKELDNRIAYESFYHLNTIQNGLAQATQQAQLLVESSEKPQLGTFKATSSPFIDIMVICSGNMFVIAACILFNVLSNFGFQRKCAVLISLESILVKSRISLISISIMKMTAVNTF